MQTQVNIHETKTSFSQLIEQVEAGGEVVIATGGVARGPSGGGRGASSAPGARGPGEHLVSPGDYGEPGRL